MLSIIVTRDENHTCILFLFVDSSYIRDTSVVVNMPCRAKTPRKFERSMSLGSAVEIGIGMQILRGKVIEL